MNGHHGPGAPIFADDPLSPSSFGFDEWVSVSNFFDSNLLMSRLGKFEEFQGEPVNWFELPQYQPFLEKWKQRWEYRGYLSRRGR